MTTPYSPSTTRETKTTRTRTSSIVNSTFTLYVSVLMMFVGSCFPALSQTNYTTKIDSFQHTNIGNQKQRLSDLYRAAVTRDSKNLLTDTLIPFFPFVTINISKEFLPPPPFRIYFAKASTARNNDYFLIVAPCKKYSKGKDSDMFTDSVSGLLSLRGIKTNANWFSIRLTTNKNNTDIVTYTKITIQNARTYIGNFSKFMLANNLRKDSYPICFVLRKTNDTKKLAEFKNRVRLHPVVNPKSISGIIKPQTTASLYGGTRSVINSKKFVFDFTGSYIMQDADVNIDTCCEAPPENGNSISN